jgi:2-haloacid dehalogenase
VVIGSDVTRQYKPHPDAYTRAAAILDLSPSAVMLVAAHNHDLAAARQAGLATGFVPRPTEYGPGQSTDLSAEADWDVLATDLIDLSRQLTTNPEEIGRKPSDGGPTWVEQSS